MIRFEGRHLKKFARTGRLASMGDGSLLCEIFHENSKVTPLSAPAMRAEIALFDRASKLARVPRAPRKVHSLADRIELPETEAQTSALEQAIAARRSVRAFSGDAVTRSELARLLRYSYGLTEPRQGLRAVASAGTLYPLELYAVVNHVEALEPGVYHYDVPTHRLDVVTRGDCLPHLSSCLWLDGIDLQKAALVIVLSAFLVRSTVKYGERGYRTVLMEAGEIAQNLSLLATTLGLASCAVHGFVDNELARLLGADGFSEVPLLPVVVGRRVPETHALASPSASAARSNERR